MFTRIKDLREDLDLSQEDIAKILHCSQVAYSYYENGERTIPPEVLIALAKFYNVSVDYILELSDNPIPNR